MNARRILVMPIAALLICLCALDISYAADPQPKTIDFEEVLWFAVRARAAYDTPEKIQKEFPNTVLIKTLKNTDVQYFMEIDHQKKCQIISIRGTASLANAKEDAQYLQSKNKKLSIYTHKGFDRDTAELYRDLLPRLNKAYDVIVTGHSLGAAISTLMMMYLHEDDFKVKPSINFGQPKVTNKKGVDHYKFLPLTRVVNEKDVVPLVPPDTLLDSIHGIYMHLGDEVILLKNENYMYFDEHNAERTSVGSFWKNIHNEKMNDHFMDSYIKNIKSKLSKATRVPYSKRKK